MPPFLRTESRLVEMQSLAYRQLAKARDSPTPKSKLKPKAKTKPQSANGGSKQAEALLNQRAAPMVLVA